MDAYKEKKEREEQNRKDEKRGERNGMGEKEDSLADSEDDEKSSHKKRKKEKRKKDKETDDRHYQPETNGHSTKAAVATDEGISALWPQLRVRIISRNFMGGKYYSSKGNIDFHVTALILNERYISGPRALAVS